MSKFSLSLIRHPDYLADSLDWARFRDIYEGGTHFRDNYLEKFSEGETAAEFEARRRKTPIPSFAKQAINEIRNSIFQRLPDVLRIGGSNAYTESMLHNVNRRGTGMNQFIGKDILTELLVIGKVGVYVDAPNLLPTTLAEAQRAPYLYHYTVEDILSWTEESEEFPGQFKAVLLRDRTLSYNSELSGVSLPVERTTRFRLVFRDEQTGEIRAKIFDNEEKVVIFDNSNPDGSVTLNLPYVPFILFDIGESLLKDVWSYQVALLNMISGSVNFDISANVPFLAIQKDVRTAGTHLKNPNAPLGPETDNQKAQDKVEKIGTTRGHYYDLGADPPSFVSPDTNNIKASIQHQEKLQDDIRRLVALSVGAKAGSRTESGEAKKISSQSLEAGLSFIGTVLQTGEQKIAETWGFYENFRNPKIATVAYPSRYSLKTDSERFEDAEKLMDLIDRTPSKGAKRVAYKQVITILLEDKVDPVLLEKILAEVDAAKVTRADLDFILGARKEGLVSDETASEALGFASGEVEQAADDHAARLERILKSQTSAQGVQNPASRGVPDLDPDTNSAQEEQAAGRENSSE